MRVALVQFTAALDSAANRAALDARLADLADVDLVLLPEASSNGFGPPAFDLSTIAEDLDGPFVGLLAGHARRLAATVVAGMFERNGDGLPFNTLVAIGPDGERIAGYRKIHLYDSFGQRESDRLAPGPLEPTVLEVAGARVGLLTCYDLRFPELARALVDAGADVLAVPAAWLIGDHKLAHWRTLLAARAIENVCWVVAAGQGAPHYCGHSFSIDAMGTTVAEAGEVDTTLVVEVDLAQVALARYLNPSLENRRMAR